ncbi:MAG: hypothetical protein WCY19_07125 [Candidatus Gastranaerophilaceae bacterium]
MINQIKPNSVNSERIFAPLQSSGVDYAISKPFTDTQKTEGKKEEEKKSNALGYSIAATALVAGFGVLALMKGLPKGARLRVDKFFKHLEEKFAPRGKDGKMPWTQRALEKAKYFINAVFNTGPAKDVLFKKLIHPIPFLRKAADGITDMFVRISTKTSRKSYRKTLYKFDELYAILDEFKSKIKPENAKSVGEKATKIEEIYKKAFSATGENSRLAGIHKGLEDLDKDVFNSMKEVFKDKNSYKTFYQYFLPEKLAAKTKIDIKSEVDASKNEIIENMNKILEIYRNQESMSPRELKKIEKMVKKCTKSLNKSTDLETDKLFDKIRDFKIGSAPLDALGVLVSLGIIGKGLAKAEDKDERISVALKYGVPALGAIMISLYCTVRLVAGGKALLVGLLSGLAINKLGVVLDNTRKKYEEKPLDLAKMDLAKMASPKEIIQKYNENKISII